jgi:cell division protein FtsI/penicillin-binding protein 2
MQEPFESNTPRRGRIALLCVAVVLMAGAIGVRLYQVQVLDGEDFRARAKNQHNSKITRAPTRGAIVDREGRALAVSLQTESLYAHPPRVERPGEAATLLAPVLGVPRSRLLAQLESSDTFVYLKRFLDSETADRVRELGLPVGGGGPFDFLPEAKRVYPKGSLGVHVLGFATIDGVGVEGIERRFEDVLRGDPTTYFVTRDARNRLVRNGIDALGRPPRDIVLTLDAVLQHMVERELERAMRDTGAAAASAILLDPRNGHVLALANRPAVDGNLYGGGTAAERRNRALVDYYEPGSTFKPVPLALALESGAVRSNQSFFCEEGAWLTRGRRIGDTSPHGMLSLRQVLAKSSNIGIVKVTRNMPSRTLSSGFEGFGFGSKTGIELPGESAGLVRDASRWSGFTQASVSFGQEIGVTVLQMASAIGAFANDGVRVPPRIVLGMRNANGTLSPARPPASTRVVSPVTAGQVRSMMETVIAEGTGTRAQLDGYRLAGKSGTAQKAVPGGYSDSEYMASFVGFGPVEDPAIVAMVVLDSPTGEWIHGGQVAAPVFGRIMSEAMPHLRIPAATDPEPLHSTHADLARQAAFPRTLPPAPETAHAAGRVPDLIGLNLRDAVRTLANLGYKAMIDGSGAVVGQVPVAGTPLVAGEVCRLRLRPANTAGAGDDADPAPEAPDLLGGPAVE